MEFDVVKLAEIVVSSTPERDPVQFSKQWPELHVILISRLSSFASAVLHFEVDELIVGVAFSYNHHHHCHL